MTSDDRDILPPEDEGAESRSSHVRAESEQADTDGESTKRRKHLPLWQETILLLVVALGLAIVIKTLFLQAFYIPSESMEPGLIKNDRILVEKPSYWGDSSPKRGDIVVFKDPGGWLGAAENAGPTSPIAKVMSKIGLYPTGGHLVKRVIGVEGDTVSCCDKQGRLEVNGKALDEPYVKKVSGVQCNGPMPSNCTTDWQVGPIPEDRIFVMGDNRSRSADSSEHMCKDGLETECVPGSEFVPVDLVVGKVFVLLWPASRFDWITSPETFDNIPAPAPDSTPEPEPAPNS